MKTTKFLCTMLLLIFAISTIKAQSKYKINLSKIIFSSGRCNGTCPNIDLEIDSAKNIFVTREYYKNRKGDVDSLHSGSFKGKLSQTKYKKLIELLQNCDINTLEFPKLRIYDKAYKTITIYYNGKKKNLSSPEPPKKVEDLIVFWI
jgi:hypothetical protein